MSSSIDYFSCPKCGGSANKEQDTSMVEISYSCKSCDWDGEPAANIAVAEVRDPDKVYIVWCWDDVQNLKPDWSPERCQTALDICSKVLESRSVEEGWTILGDLLVINEDEIEEAVVSPE